ncbi:MAG: hypothetical protein U1A27_08280 [Phycisphaerae bacterium]
MTIGGRLLPALAALAIGVPARAAPPLGEEIADGGFGFALRPPSGWRIDRQRAAQQAGLVVLRLIHESEKAGTQVITVRVSPGTRTMPIDATLGEFAAALTADLKEVQITEKSVRTVGPLPAGYLSARFQLGGRPTILLASVIQARPRQYFVLLYNGAAESQAEIEPLFRAVTDSFRSFDTDATDAAMRRALLAGTDWLPGLTAKRIAAVPESETWFSISRGVERLGYVQRTVRHSSAGQRDAIAISEQGWTFAADGAARRVFNEMELTTDQRTESWRSATLTLVPARERRPATVDLMAFTGAREGKRIISEQRFGTGGAPEANPTLDAPPTYISRALVRLAPQLLDRLDKPRILAFHQVDDERRGLIPWTIEVAPDTARSKLGRTLYRIVEREGMVVPIAETYISDKGEVLKISIGDTVLRQASKADLEATFGARVAEAEKSIMALDKESAEYQRHFSAAGAGAPVTVQPR